MAVQPSEVLCDPAEVGRVIGAAPTDPRLILATITASRFVATRTGQVLADPPITDTSTLVVVVVPAAAAVRQATVAAAVRFYKGPDVPFGLAGVDLQAYVRSAMPEVDLALLGYRMDFGVG